MAYQGPNFYAYNIASLELVPRLLCGTEGDVLHEWGTGSRNVSLADEISYDTSYRTELWDGNKINTDVYFEVDYSDPKSFHNWMTDQELYCYSGFQIGLLGSMFFLGLALSGILLKMSDYIGRLNVVKIGQVIQILCCYSFYFSNNIYSYYITMLFLGITWGKNMSCYLLLSETWPKSTHVYISAVVVASDNFISLLVIPLYFYLGGKHWKQIFSVTLFLPLIAFVMMFFIPESPRYLYSRKRYTELDETMRYIAKVNKIEYNINSKEDIDIYRLSHTQSHLQISSKSFKNEPDYHEKEYSIFDDLRRPVVIFNILIILIGYTVVSYSNYLLMIYTKYIGGVV